MKQVYLVIPFLLLPLWVASQCGVVGPMAIPVQGNNYTNFRINNAANDDLSSPGQGICSISLRFTHSSIGDVNLILSSPNGQQYVLMRSKGSRSTLGTTWDIRFVPCNVPSSPDQGNFIKPVWDSDQDWGENNAYSGSYHAQACLETIAAGPVNGVWSVTASDTRGENGGVIENFDIQFCDPAAITCAECVRLGGRIDLDTTFVCGGDPSLGSIRIFPTYTGAEPSPSLYTYRFVVVNEGVILDITDRPSLITEGKGDYRIFGLSIANQDLALLDGFIGGSLGALSNALNPGRLLMCGAYSSGFKVYRILSDPDPRTQIEMFVCPQAPISFNNQLITTPGNYQATFTSVTGCDSIVDLVVTAFSITQPIIDPGTLSCSNKPLTLEWPNNQFAIQPSYRWSTTDGSILSNPRLNNVQIDLPGQYQLIIAKDGCADTLTSNIQSDGSLPSLDVTDIVMDCAANIGQLRPISDANRFSWVGPNGFSATTQNVDVTEPGAYTITATGAACAVRKTVQVAADFDQPENIQVQGGSIRCANDTIQLNASSTTPGVTYIWTGPNMFTSSDQNPFVTSPGVYTVRIGSPNSGCATQENVDVANLFSEPSINITGVTLDCAGLAKNIVTVVSDPLATFSWTGPSGFTSSSKSPRVSAPGQYNVIIKDAQQCTYENMAVVALDTAKPTVSASDLTLDCMQTDFTLTASSFGAHPLNFTWTGPNGYRANQMDPTATQAGTYRITVRDPVNSCSATTTISVAPHPMQPELRTETGVINCAQSQDTLVVEALTNCAGGCTYLWTGPNGFSSTNDTVIVTEGGNYDVLVTTTATGCFSKAAFNVPMNTTPIQPNVRVSDIGCTTDGSLLLINNSVFTQYTWFDTVVGTELMNTRTQVVSSPSTYDLYSEDRNGCRDTMTYDVGITDDIPVVNILSDTINCAIDTVSLGVSIDNYSNGQISSYQWTLPDGEAFGGVIPRISTTGMVRLDVVMRNGCMGSTSTSIVSDFAEPQLTAIGGGYRCSEPGVDLDFTTQGTPLLTNWTGPNGFRTASPRPLAPSPGTYVLEILGPNGCPATDSAVVNITDVLPSLTAFGDTISCLDTIADLSFTTDAAAGFSFQWLDPGGRINNNLVIQTVLPGPYLLELEDVNACRVVREVRVELDTATFGHSIESELISCLVPNTELSLDTIYPFLNYSWIFDSTQIATTAEPIVSEGGLYHLQTANLNGCSRIIRHQVEADTVRPSFELEADTLDCSNTRLSLIPSSRDRTWSYDWIGPNNFTSASAIPLIDQPGQYRLKATAQNGCELIRNVEIGSDFSLPMLEITNTFIPCNNNPAIIQFETSDTLAEVNWFGPNGFYEQSLDAATRIAGRYFVLAKGFNGCEVFDSIEVSADPLLEPLLVDSLHIDCANPEGFLAILNVDTAFSYTWSDEQSNITIDTVVRSLSGGLFSLEARHIPSDCFLAEEFTIQIDTLTPTLGIVEMDSIICERREITLGSEVARPVTFSWSTNDGNIVGGSEGAEVRLDLPGTYQLQIRDTLNHCENQASIDITEKANNLLGFSVAINFADCHGLNDGVILVDTIEGGSAPYNFSLGGEFFSTRNAYQFLAPDDYLVVVKDINGCAFDTLVTLERHPTFNIDLGEEMLINLGDTATLMTEISLGDGEIEEILWSDPIAMSCQDCSEQMVSPLTNTYYSVSVRSDYGCTEEDTVLVRVSDRDGLFVPNGFTPDGDGMNDFVEVFAGNNIEQITAYEIFDRWGNNVYSAFNFLPGDELARWNGTYRGSHLNPGVFIYLVQAVNIRGEVKYKTGDITLIR